MRIKVTLSYDGTNYYGYQHQPGKITVQDTFEEKLSVILKEHTKTVASGRTDGHVHALGQVLHFDTSIKMKEANWMRALNSLLPDDIRVKNVEFVSDDFHARFSVVKKEYRYYITLGEYDLFKNNYSAYYEKLDVSKMKDATKYFLGTHDFTSYSRYVDKKPTIRTIYKAEIVEKEDGLEIIFIGNGFLKYMVRIMVGTLIDVGLGKKSATDVLKILDAKDRTKASKTASPNGLFLYKVYYKEGE
ncbi:MAG: tRNA pseudouridine(38-40) synthase TruA [bacterium]|nr:tRNA pseudouridine(38-40) synthase TruA [bacterium]